MTPIDDVWTSLENLFRTIMKWRNRTTNRLIIMYLIFITKYTEYENANPVSQNGFSRFRQTFK